MKYLYEKYKNSNNLKRKDVATLMYNRYKPSSLRESSPLNIDKDTSYTINKGDLIAICIRNGINYGIHDLNTIMFVVLHELTHLSIKSFDHPQEFWECFIFILKEAAAYNIYKITDYVLQPTEYCGIEISYQPALDSTLKDI